MGGQSYREVENTKLTTTQLIVIVLLAISLGFVIGSPLLQAVTVPFDPVTKTSCTDHRIRGGNLGGEIFDDKEYSYAWERTGQSEKIDIRATIENCQTLSAGSVKVRYEVLINNGVDGSEVTRGGVKYDRLRTDAFPDGVYRPACHGNDCTPLGAGRIALASPPPFRIDGYAYKDEKGELKPIHDGSVIRVDVWDVTVTDAGQLTASDQARLRSAIPDVEWKAGAYKVGETAVACWEVPRVTIENATGYYGTVLELNGHTAAKDAAGVPIERRPITSVTGCFRVPVLDAYFATSEPCTNALRVVIYSPILKVDDDETSVQPAVTITGGDPPSLTDVRFDRKEYREGETIHVVLTGSGRITKWYVRATIEGLEALPGTFLGGGTTANVTFVATQTGTLELEARPYNGCVPGETKEFRVVIEPEIPSRCELFPDVCRDGGLPWFALAAGVVLALAGVGILVGSKGNVVFVLVGVGLLVLGVVLFGGALVAIVGAVL